MKSVAVVGAGLAGLTAAYRLQRHGYRVVVLEASGNVGGRAQTSEIGGYTINTAAGAISDAYVSYRALVKELGLDDIIEPASPVFGTVRDWVVHDVDSTRLLSSGLTTRLISWRSKLTMLRLFIDVARAKRQGVLNFADIDRASSLDFETASEYARRRLNNEINDYICDPLTRTTVLINATEVSKVDIFSGMANISSVALYGVRGGVNYVPRVLARALNVTTHCPVSSIERDGRGVCITWRVDSGNKVQEFDACVVACPLPVAADLLPSNQSLQSLAGVLEYSQAVTVAIGTTRAPGSRASVVQVPAKESADVCLFLLGHNIVKSSVPAGHGLLVAYWESSASAAAIDNCSDAEIEQRTLAVVTKVFPDVADHIDMIHISRLPIAAPLTRVGSYAAMQEFNLATRDHTTIQFCGDYMSAFSQETAVEQGNRAAGRLMRALPG